MLKKTGSSLASNSSLRRWLHAAIVALVAFAIPVGVSGQEPEVLVELSRERIFQGESVRYSVTLNGFGDEDKPVLSKLDEIDVQQRGVTITRQTIFDGFKRTSIGGPRYEYILSPKRAGEFTIPGPTAVFDGKTYRGKDVKLRVMPPNEQDLVVMEVAAVPSKVYPLQPFKLRLTVAVKALPDPDGDEEPLEMVRQAPVLIIPWADDDEIPDGVRPDKPAANFLRSYLQTTNAPGFGINNIRVRSDELFSLFTEQQRAVFRPQPQRVKRKDRRGVTVDYWEYTFERELRAERIGNYSFGAVTLKGSFVSRSKSGNRYDLEDVYAISPPVEVDVHDAPSTGRPDSYIGAIGRFDVDAELNPTRVKVGDPMTFTLTVRGTGTLQNAFPPKVESLAAIADHFKVYETTEESTDTERKFVYRLRPRDTTLKEFPAIDVSYFDPRDETYHTVRTDPIDIEVAQAERMSAQDIAVAGGGSVSSPELASKQKGLLANITDPSRIRNEVVREDLWLAGLGGMAVAFATASVLVRWRQHAAREPDAVRKRNAAQRAQSRLQEARQFDVAKSPQQALEAVRQSISGLIADATGVVDSALTPRDVAESLNKVGIDESLARRAQDLFENLDAVRYGKMLDSVDHQIGSAESLLHELMNEFRRRKLIS